MNEQHLPDLLLLTNAASAWALCGLIWVIQWVHYPLFALVGRESFEKYEAAHVRRITVIVAPLMMIELVTSIMLIIIRPSAVPFWCVAVACALLAMIWLSTWLMQIPVHQRLTAGFTVKLCADLIKTNWIRTIAWSARAVLTAWMLWLCLREPLSQSP